MKLPILKKIYNRLMLTFAFCVIMLFSSCEKNDDPAAAKPTLTLESFQPKDYGNEGNASDIFLTSKFSGTLDKFGKLRFIFTSSTSAVDVAKALSLPDGTYAETDFSENTEITFSEGLKDADGVLISEGKSYTIFILGIPSAGSGDAVLIEGTEVLTLVDEIVVTTPKLNGTLSAMEDISIDPQNNLYISGGSLNTSRLFKISPDGTITVLSAGLNHPVGNTVDGNGNLYVTNFQSVNINLVTSTGTTSVFASDPRLVGGGGIIVDNDGVLYNTFYAIKTIYAITAGSVKEFVTSDLLNGPVGMAYDAVNDKIFVANFSDGRIFHVAKDKTLTQIADTPATIGHLDYRAGVFYATGWNEHKVYVVSMTGEILATIGNGTKATVDGRSSEASFFSPNGIAVSKDGKYIYVSQGDGKLRKIVL